MKTIRIINTIVAIVAVTVPVAIPVVVAIVAVVVVWADLRVCPNNPDTTYCAMV